MSRKAILAGGSGLVGRALARKLDELGWEVVILTRSPRQKDTVAREVQWDGANVGPWVTELEGAAAIVNLAGRSLNCLFTPQNRREILESRIDSAKALGEAVRTCQRPPSVWVQTSAVGLYGSMGAEMCTESTSPGEDFLAQVCVQWEGSFAAQTLPATRRVVLRLGVVLDRKGGAYPPLARLAKCFIGGPAGSGRQGFSWIHGKDMTAAFVAMIQRPDMSGVYNVCAPEPVTNAALMRSLRHSVGRPWAPPAPAWAVKIAARYLMRTEPQLVLEGRSCVPERLLAESFAYQFPRLDEALQDLARG
jgi:uncharacterized protein